MKQIIYLLFVSLSLTTLSFFKIGLAEFTLFHVVAIITLLLLFWFSLRKTKLTIPRSNYFFVFTLYIIIVNLVYFDQIKITSFIYSLIVLLELLLLFTLVRSLSNDMIKIIVKAVILLYFINILVGTVFILLHIDPVGFLGYIFKIYNFDDRIRPYGFANEPSYAALILIFSFFVLLKCDDFIYKKKEFRWYLAVIISVLLTRSTYGYMLLIFLLTYFILQSHTLRIHLSEIIRSKLFSNTQILLGFLILILGIIFIFYSIDFENIYSLKRLTDISGFVLRFGIDIPRIISKLELTDGSAVMRIKPSIYLYEYFQKVDLQYVLFGRGAGQTIIFFTKLYENRVTSLGFIPSFIYNYGIVGSIVGISFFLSLFPKEKWFLFLLFFLFLFNADFNTQIFLFVLASIMFCKQIEKNKQALVLKTINEKN